MTDEQIRAWADAHAIALQAIVDAVRAETVEECAKEMDDMFHNDYGGKEPGLRLRSLVKERKGD